MKNECCAVRDLLPLYLENMVSEETARFVFEHLQECPECRGEYETMKTEGIQTQIMANEKGGNDIRPFKKLMKKINRKTSVLSYGLIVLFVFFGFMLTDGSNMMFNSLIMPIVGVFGYIAFRWKAVYKMPVLLLAIDFAAYALGVVALELEDVFFWSLLYGMFVLAGVAVAFLLHYACGGEITK